MYKKIIFSLIIFSSLFVGKEAFADFQYLKEVEPENVSGNTYCFKDIDYDEIRSWGAWPDGMGVLIITDTNFQNPIGISFGGNNMDCGNSANLNLDDISSNSLLSDGNYFLIATTRRPANYQTSDFPDPFKAIYFEFSVLNGSVAYVPSTSPASCTDGIQNQDETGIDSGGVCSTLTRLYSVDPTDNDIVPSQTFSLDYNYYLNSFTDARINTIEFRFCPLSYDFEDCEVYTIDGSYLTFDELVFASSDFTVSKQGDYQVILIFTNGVPITASCPWYAFWCESQTRISSAGDTFVISVVSPSGTNGIPPAVSLDEFFAPDHDFSVCSMLDGNLGDCISKTASYLFLPSDRFFSRLNFDFESRAPFVYAFQFRDFITSLSSPTSNDVSWSVSFGSLGSLNVLSSDTFYNSPYSSFFSHMRTYLGLLLWILLAIGLYKRVLTYFDENTTN